MTTNTTTAQILDGEDFTTIDLADDATWPAGFDPQALYDEAGAAGDMDLCRTMERLGIAG